MPNTLLHKARRGGSWGTLCAKALSGTIDATKYTQWDITSNWTIVNCTECINLASHEIHSINIDKARCGYIGNPISLRSDSAQITCPECKAMAPIPERIVHKYFSLNTSKTVCGVKKPEDVSYSNWSDATCPSCLEIGSSTLHYGDTRYDCGYPRQQDVNSPLLFVSVISNITCQICRAITINIVGNTQAIREEPPKKVGFVRLLYNNHEIVSSNTSDFLYKENQFGECTVTFKLKKD